MDDWSKVPERFRNANDAMDAEIFKIENLLIAFRFAALWDRENPNLEGPAWSNFFEETLAERATALAAKASELQTESARIAVALNQENIRDAYSVMTREVSKLQDLLFLFEVVGVAHDEKGHDEKVNFAAAFEFLLDSIKRIRESSVRAWDIAGEPYKQVIETEKGGRGGR